MPQYINSLWTVSSRWDVVRVPALRFLSCRKKSMPPATFDVDKPGGRCGGMLVRVGRLPADFNLRFRRAPRPSWAPLEVLADTSIAHGSVHAMGARGMATRARVSAGRKATDELAGRDGCLSMNS